MSNKSQYQTVALVLQNEKTIVELSTIFRKLKTLCIIYSDIQDFWNSFSKDQPSLVIFDVCKMSDASENVLEHPLVKNNQINLAFVYNPSSRALVSTTHNTFHFGLIDESYDISGQLKQVLTRLNKFKFLVERSNELIDEKAQINSRLNLIKEDQEKYISKKRFEQQIDLICNRYLKEDRKNQGQGQFDFVENIHRFLSEWKIVDEYTIYFQDIKAWQIKSFPMKNKIKYKKLPPIYLDDCQEMGISKLNLVMASHICHETWGKNNIILKISGSCANPDLLICLHVNSLFEESELWGYLEDKIVSYYRHSLLKANEKNNRFIKKLVSPWEFLKELNSMSKMISSDNNESGHLFKLSLEKLIQSYLVENFNKKERFFDWDLFLNDFLKGVTLNVNARFICTWGNFSEIIFFFSDYIEDGSIIYDQFKNYIQHFSFDKYAETLMVSKKDKRWTLKIVPLSRRDVLKYLESGAKNILKKEIERIRL